jgi:hypothetical protein
MQPTAVHTPCPPQLFGHLAFEQSKPVNPGMQLHTPSTQAPLPEQLLGHDASLLGKPSTIPSVTPTMTAMTAITIPAIAPALSGIFFI